MVQVLLEEGVEEKGVNIFLISFCPYTQTLILCPLTGFRDFGLTITLQLECFTPFPPSLSLSFHQAWLTLHLLGGALLNTPSETNSLFLELLHLFFHPLNYSINYIPPCSKVNLLFLSLTAGLCFTCDLLTPTQL